MTSKTKIRYIQDMRNPNRIMTLVTRVDGDTLTCAVSVNLPSRQILTEYSDRSFLGETTPGDTFDKKKGKLIAFGRLDCAKEGSNYVLPIDTKTQHPLVLALEALATDKRESAIASSRIARAELEVLRLTTPDIFDVAAHKRQRAEEIRQAPNA